MIDLPEARDAWNSPEFGGVLKRELMRLGTGELPLQQALSATSYALDEAFEVMIVGATDTHGHIHARVGVFFSGLIAGCNCANDPTPVEPQSEYCELMIDIDKATARASVAVAP